MEFILSTLIQILLLILGAWLAWYLSRPTIHIRATVNNKKILPAKPTNDKFIWIKVTNRGNTPTTIDGVWVKGTSTKWEHWLDKPALGYGRATPSHLLKPGEIWEHEINQSHIAIFAAKKYLYFCVKHSQSNRLVHKRLNGVNLPSNPTNAVIVDAMHKKYERERNKV